jgi:hypothetical protein
MVLLLEDRAQMGQALGQMGQALGQMGQALGQMGQALGQMGQALGPHSCRSLDLPELHLRRNDAYGEVFYG